LVAPVRCSDALTLTKLGPLWIGLTLLLGTVCLVCNEVLRRQSGQDRAAAGDAQRQQILQQLLPVLPQLPRGLRLVAEHETLAADQPNFSPFVEEVLNQCANILAVIDTCLAAPAGPAGGGGLSRRFAVSSLADVSVCCAASSALLLAVPPMAALADQQQQRVEGERAGPTGDAQLTRQVFLFVGKCAASTLHFSCGLGSGGSWSAADCTAAAEALWQVHTALCRWFYSSAADFLATRDAVKQMMGCMHVCMHSAARISTAGGLVETSSGAEPPFCYSKVPRQVGASCL
jgi:hypothetical protein